MKSWKPHKNGKNECSNEASKSSTSILQHNENKRNKHSTFINELPADRPITRNDFTTHIVNGNLAGNN